MEKNYRFRTPQFRVFNKTEKKMIYSNQEGVAFVLNSSGFSVLAIDKEGNTQSEALAQDENSVLMTGAGRRDDKNTDIYEGDVVFARKLMAGRQFLPICGIVNSKDFTFSFNSGVKHFIFDYSDKDILVLGNIFENTDDELAEKAKVLFEKYSEKKS